MSSTIAALPPPTQHIPHEPEYDGAPDVPEIAFNELWQNKEEGMSFGDFIDIINPLQHIPIISTIYRLATEDDIGVGSRVIGGTLFGGPLGLIGAGLTAIFEEVSGGSVEEHVASLWNAVTDEDAAPAQIAAAEESGPSQAALPVLEDDYAAVVTLSATVTGETKPSPGHHQTATNATITPLQMASVTQLSPQPMPRPPVTVAPLTAIHRVSAQDTRPPTGDRGADRQRIAEAIDQAQRAQAGLLLASLGADRIDKPAETDARETVEQTQPFKAHPYMLPRGAPPQLISQAMEQALAKYQTTLQQRSAATTAASPRPAPAPIQ